MRAAGKLAATRTVAILEYVFRAVKLVADSATKTASLDGFTHVDLPMQMYSCDFPRAGRFLVNGSLAWRRFAQQIRRELRQHFAQAVIGQVRLQ